MSCSKTDPKDPTLRCNTEDMCTTHNRPIDVCGYVHTVRPCSCVKHSCDFARIDWEARYKAITANTSRPKLRVAASTREEVYDAIDGERAYQDNLPDSRTDGRRKTVGDFLTLLAVYVRKGQEDYASGAGDGAALHQIRKVAGIAVRSMEELGALPRTKK